MTLIKLGNGLYRIQDEHVTIEGQWSQIRAQLLFEYEIPNEELEMAIDDMNQKGNDCADFGLDQHFQFSYDSKTQRNISAELKAIAELRLEFFKAFKRNPRSIETQQAAERLQMLYISLNVEGCLLALGEKKAS